ncbi:MAG TPA: cell division topological specificity factor MinE [Candidatus Binatia bacterium]|nr:cell division topological specificity factor MinE [Candidatus Binatia bacterium]
MIEFLKRLFGHQGSSATAKERLRLVLMTDHLELAPEMIEQMKRELVEVISRHVEVDREHIEVNFERQDRTLALLANIPILSVNRPNGKAESTPPPPKPPKPASAKAATRNGEAPPSRKRRRRKKSQSQPQASTAPA